MRRHSIIIDDFFDDPLVTRAELLRMPMQDREAQGIVYPGIVEVPDHIEDEVLKKISLFYSRPIFIDKMFARFSFEHMAPPNWAHCDLELAQFVGLIFMSPVDHPWDGTHLVRHKELGIERAVKDPVKMKRTIDDSNDKDSWDITFTAPSRFNRLVIYNGHDFHAAAGRFGNSKETARLVCTAFFKLL